MRRFVALFATLAVLSGVAALADEYIIDGETLTVFDWTQHSCNSLSDCATAIEAQCTPHGGGRSSALAAQTNPEFYPEQCEGRCRDGHSVTILCVLAKVPAKKPTGPTTGGY